MKDFAWWESQVFIFWVAPLTMSTLIQKLAVFIFWPLEHCPCHWPCLVCPSRRSHTVHVTCDMFTLGLLHFLLPSSWNLREQIRVRRGRGQAYSRLPNDLCYSPSMYYPWCLSCHVYSRTWRHPPPPPPAWQSRVTEPHDEMPGTQWRRHDHRVRYGNCGGEIL